MSRRTFWFRLPMLLLIAWLVSGCPERETEGPDVAEVDPDSDGSADATPERCRFRSGRDSLFTLPEAIREASGLGAGITDPEIFWLHNDSGDGPNLYALDRETGEERGRLTLDGVEAVDWEDMAVARCGEDRAGYCLFVADTGDNRSRRELVTIYRVPEPSDLRGPLLTSDFDAMTVRYALGPIDVEALFVADGEVWLLSKRFGGFEVFHHPFEPRGEVTIQAAKSVEFVAAFPELRSPRELVTAADWSGERRALTIRTYGHVFVFGWGSPADTAAIDVFDDPSLILEPGPEFQGEAIGWVDEGIVHVAEGLRSPVWLIPCR